MFKRVIQVHQIFRFLSIIATSTREREVCLSISAEIRHFEPGEKEARIFFFFFLYFLVFLEKI